MATGKSERKLPEKIPVSEAADRLGELTKRVAFGGETIILTWYKKPVAMMVPINTAA